ncbi:AtpZ/AtpI family protein [Candidatus Peregrinibacteria bacterium]|nr:AtpZ/AtpI family protein [Candidatus Peregrinibacteria bacterium]
MLSSHPPDGQRRTVVADLWFTVQLAWHLGYIIAIPAVLFGFGGAFLDRMWGTSPLFILMGFALAALLSSWGVLKKIRRILHNVHDIP